MQFTHDTLPILGRGNGVRPWDQHHAEAEERAQLAEGGSVRTGDDSSALTKIKLAKAVTIPADT